MAAGMVALQQKQYQHQRRVVSASDRVGEKPAIAM